jgi:hypothetical protein
VGRKRGFSCRRWEGASGDSRSRGADLWVKGFLKASVWAWGEELGTGAGARKALEAAPME